MFTWNNSECGRLADTINPTAHFACLEVVQMCPSFYCMMIWEGGRDILLASYYWRTTKCPRSLDGTTINNVDAPRTQHSRQKSPRLHYPLFLSHICLLDLLKILSSLLLDLPQAFSIPSFHLLLKEHSFYYLHLYLINPALLQLNNH